MHTYRTTKTHDFDGLYIVVSSPFVCFPCVSKILYTCSKIYEKLSSRQYPHREKVFWFLTDPRIFRSTNAYHSRPRRYTPPLTKNRNRFRVRVHTSICVAYNIFNVRGYIYGALPSPICSRSVKDSVLFICTRAQVLSSRVLNIKQSRMFVRMTLCYR